MLHDNDVATVNQCVYELQHVCTDLEHKHESNSNDGLSSIETYKIIADIIRKLVNL